MEQSTFWSSNPLHNDILRRGLLNMSDAGASSPPWEDPLFNCNPRACRPSGKINNIAAALDRYLTENQ